MGSSDVHDRVCAEHNVSNDGEAFTGQTLREEAVGVGMIPERPAQPGGGVASCLGGLGKLRLKTFGLGSHLEQRPCPLRDTDRDVGEGFNPFGQGVCGHRCLSRRAMGDIDRLCVAHECLVDDPAEQGCLRSEADVNGTSSDSGALGDLGKCGGHVALIKEECARGPHDLGLGSGHSPGPQVRSGKRLPLDVVVHKMQYNCIDTVGLQLGRFSMIPKLAGVHHLKLPVSDLDRSIRWYATRLGYQVVIEFRDGGRRTGVAMTHPDGGPDLALNLNPDRAKASAGFDYFSIGVPDRDGIEALAAHLSSLGETHAGVHFATIGWILPMLHDPDGHEVRFYSMESHTEIDPAAPLVIDNAVVTARAKEERWRADRAAPDAVTGLDKDPDAAE